MDDDGQRRRRAAIRVVCAFAAGLAFCLGVYVLIEYARPGGLITFSFVLILPAAVTAFIVALADPFREHPRRFYIVQVPIALLIAVMAASITVLPEGTICIVMLAPIWLGLSTLGGYVAWRFLGPREDDAQNRIRSSALLLLPLLAAQIEPLIPLPVDRLTVTRSIDIRADPTMIWTLAKGVPAVGAREGRWNFSQDVIGVPRPVGAHMAGEGVGAVRNVAWQEGIRFQEVVTDWQPSHRLWWNFRFDPKDMAAWGIQDRHLLPDSEHYRITDGGYTLSQLGHGRTRLTLTTRYTARTPFNWYARLWGEVFIGDVSSNVLAVIAARAESMPDPALAP